MKRLLGLLLIAPIFLIFVSFASAQELRSVDLPADGQSTGSSGVNTFPGRNGVNNLTGELHNYSLILKGNGNAVVLGRINFSNSTDGELNNYQMEIPEVTPQNLTVFQEIPQPVCTQYKNDGTCLRYDYSLYPDPYNSVYKKLKPVTSGSKVSIDLAETVKVASSSGLIFSYNWTGYSKNTMNRYDFNFQTPKVKNSIQTLNLSIDTDNKSLYLKVNGEKVDYSQTSAATTLDSLGAKSEAGLRMIAPSIGNGGRVYKTVSNLSAGESVKVTGSYSDSMLFLNLTKITIFGLSFLALVVFLAIIIKIGLLAKIGNLFNTRNLSGNNLVLIDFSFGLISSVLVGSSILFIKHFFGSQNLYFGYSPDSSLNILLGILLFLYYGVVLILPGVIIALKFGLKHLLGYIFFLFFWLVVMTLGYVVVFPPSSSQPPFRIQPLENSGAVEKSISPSSGDIKTNQLP